MLGDLPEGAVILNEAAGNGDYVLAFANDSDELNLAARTFLKALTYDGVLWIAFPKKSSKIQTDLSRDKGYEILSKAGLRPVSLVSINEKWSALRFRPTELVK